MIRLHVGKDCLISDLRPTPGAAVHQRPDRHRFLLKRAEATAPPPRVANPVAPTSNNRTHLREEMPEERGSRGARILRNVARDTFAGVFIASLLWYGLHSLTTTLAADTAALLGASLIVLAVASWVGQHIGSEAEDLSPLAIDRLTHAHRSWTMPLQRLPAGLWIGWTAENPWTLLGLYLVLEQLIGPIARMLWRRWRRTPISLNPRRLLYPIAVLACGVVLGTLLRGAVK